MSQWRTSTNEIINILDINLKVSKVSSKHIIIPRGFGRQSNCHLPPLSQNLNKDTFYNTCSLFCLLPRQGSSNCNPDAWLPLNHFLAFQPLCSCHPNTLRQTLFNYFLQDILLRVCVKYVFNRRERRRRWRRYDRGWI